MSPARDHAAAALLLLTEAIRLGRRTGDGKLARDLAAVQKHLAEVLDDGRTQVAAKQDEGGLIVRRPVRVTGGLLDGELLK
jgi:hypothetical protein